MMAVADEILERTAKLDPGDDRVLDDLLRGILDLRRRGLYQNLDYLRFLQEEALTEGDVRANQYRDLIADCVRAKMLLDKAAGRYTRGVTTSR
jgi:hypothetical protein